MDLETPRPKKFVSMDSLWYEDQRLATFIDWPLKFISEEELAAEGFYYLRTKDHCACAFCRGIIGSWEDGDTPRGEHKRHFPNCPFVQGKVTPNVPLNQGKILAKVPRSSVDVSGNLSKDVCGHGKFDDFKPCSEGRVFTKSSKDPEVSMSSLGFRQYCGPKSKDFIIYEVRLNTYKLWPEKVKQTPQSLAEAGFYYCGLSDHVRCFHCGNGLRNWEPEDKPWEEHARWYPDCHYVLLKKGIDFVDKVRRERPPYIPSHPNLSAASSSGAVTQSFEKSNSNILNDKEMEVLMELPIIKGVLDMGFSRSIVKKALKRYILKTGSPFFTLESGIEVVLEVMEEETQETIHGCKNIAMQAKNISNGSLEQSPDQQTNISFAEETLQQVEETSNVIQQIIENEIPIHETSSLPAASVAVDNNEILNISLQTEISIDNSRHLREPTVVEELPNGTPSADTEETNAILPLEYDGLNDHASGTINQTDNMSKAATSLPIPDLIDSNESHNTTIFSPLPIIYSSCTSSNSLTPLPSISTASPPLRSSTPTSHIDDRYPQPMDLESANQDRNSSTDVLSTIDVSSAEVASSTIERTVNTHSSVAINRSHPDRADLPMEYYSEELPENIELPVGVYPLISEAEVAMEEAAKLLLAPPISAGFLPGETCQESKYSEKTTKKNRNFPKDDSNNEEKNSQFGGKADKLAQELERLKDNRICKVCMDKEMDVVFLPCTHMVTCSSCAVALASCPICRRDIQYAFKPIIS